MKQRIPKSYFITKGAGESRHTVHAGSLHAALYQAGIYTQNIMTYSSILPKGAIEVDQPDELPFGAVLETIMSVCTGRYGEKLAAGIAYTWLYDDNGNKIGGLVVERNGNYDEDTLIEVLNDSLFELYNKTFNDYTIKDDQIEYITKVFTPDDVYGTALVAMCFIDYED